MLKYDKRLFGIGMSMLNSSGDVALTSLGYQQAITTLTALQKKTVEQKFFEQAPADLIPMSVGEYGYMAYITRFKEFLGSGSFAEGNIGQGLANAKLAEIEAGMSPVSVPTQNWAKRLSYTKFEIEQGLRTGVWDVVTAKQRALKKNWDLGLQETAFLGLPTGSSFLGLYTQTSVNTDTSIITKTISSMSTSEYITFVSAIIEAYRSNCARTAWPNLFVIPEDDYNGLGAPLNTTYPNISKLEYLSGLFAKMVPGGCEIKSSPYGMPTYNTSRSINLHRYLLYRYDPDSLEMLVPVPFQMTAPGTADNFTFGEIGYAEYTGVVVYRPLEVLYLDF